VFLPPAAEADFQAKKAAGERGQMTAKVQPGTRILLAEDNDENVVLIQAYLENLAVALDVAENGRDAVAKRQSNEYDLVLMDVQMPIMDGYTAASQIRCWEKANGKQRVPIVAVTAHALSGDAGESIAAGCDAHLTKPLERHELIEAIVKFTKQPAPRAEALSDLVLARRPAFLSNRSQDLEKIRAALNTGDFAVIQKIAHNCKGIGKGYGFPRISEIGAWLEKAAKAQDGQEIAVAVGDFESYLKVASDAAA